MALSSLVLNFFWLLGACPVPSAVLSRSDSVRTEVAVPGLNSACCACMLCQEWLPRSWRGASSSHAAPQAHKLAWATPCESPLVWVRKLLTSYVLHKNLHLPTLKDLLALSYSNFRSPFITCFCCWFSLFLRQVFFLDSSGCHQTPTSVLWMLGLQVCPKTDLNLCAPFLCEQQKPCLVKKQKPSRIHSGPEGCCLVHPTPQLLQLEKHTVYCEQKFEMLFSDFHACNISWILIESFWDFKEDLQCQPPVTWRPAAQTLMKTDSWESSQARFVSAGEMARG